MAAGITFRVGGALDPSFKGAMAASVAEAKVSAAAMMRGMNREIAALKTQLVVAPANAPNLAATAAAINAPILASIAMREKAITNIVEGAAAERMAIDQATTAERLASNQEAIAVIVAEEKAAGIVYENQKAAELAALDIVENEKIALAIKTAAAQKLIDAETTTALIASTQGALEWAQIAEEERVALAAKAAAERVAIMKAEQLAMLTTVATKGIAGSAFGHYGGPGGGISGIMRETLVIFRELGRGNLTRVPGSVLLLAQYMGILGVVVKSTAAESILAAAAEEKLAGSMARAALVAEAKAARSLEATTAVGADVAATEALALADMESADAARLAAVAQTQKAEAAAQAAAIQKAGAVTTIGPIGWLAAAVIALGAAAYFTYRHFHALAVEARNLAALMNPLKTSMKSATDAEFEAVRAHQAYLDKMKQIASETESFIDLIGKEIKSFKALSQAQIELARARGASGVDIERMEEAQLAAELAMLRAAKATAEQKRDEAKSAADAAQATLDQFDVVNLTQKKGVAENAGQVLQSVQLAAQTGPLGEWVDLFKKAQKEGKGNMPISELAPAFKNEGFFKGIGLTGKETVNQAIQNIPITGAVVGGQKLPPMTLAAAESAYKTAETEALNLEKSQKGLSDSVNTAVDAYKKANDAVIKFGDQVDETQQELGIKQKYGREIAELEKSRGGGRGGNVTERERIGLGSPQIALLDVSKQHLAVSRQQLAIMGAMQRHAEKSVREKRQQAVESGHAGYFDHPGF